MHPEAREELLFQAKVTAIKYALAIKNDVKACRDLKIPRSTFSYWKAAYKREGIKGLYRKKPVAYSHPGKTPQKTVDRILALRIEYQLGPRRISWYLERYHGISCSASTVSRTLVKHGLSRLPKTAPRRSLHTRRYVKEVPGHHIQVDVKFVTLTDSEGKKIRRFQYTAIDDATRIRALKIYPKHNQQCAMDFIDYVIDKFPFRIHTIRTDRGHEFQALFHWHVEDKGMEHVYIKPKSPQLNGKVERSHRTDRNEFYQLLTYTDDVDLNDKLKLWEHFYNFDRPHYAFNGKTPYEVLKDKLKSVT